LGHPPAPSEHADLFTFNVYPYASVYLDSKGQLGGEARARVAGFWDALAIEPASDPDHATSLIGLLAELIERSDHEPEPSKRLLLREAASACLFEHLVPWIPTFLRAVRTHGPGYYREWAAMLSRALSVQAETFNLEAVPRFPVHLEAVEPIRTPEEVGGSAFLEQILAPVRTGIVVSRQDMARLGRDVGLGARLGERRYMLEAYLGQDPHGTLDWMAVHADGWIDRDDEPVSRLRDFWSERASNTADVLRVAAGQALEFSPGAATLKEAP